MMEVCDAPDSGDKHTAKEYQAFRALLPAQYPHAPQQCKAWNLICWYCFVTGFRIWGFLLLPCISKYKRKVSEYSADFYVRPYR